MKKILGISAAITLASLTIAACGDEGDDGPSSKCIESCEHLDACVANDCETECAKTEEAATVTDCREGYDALYDCYLTTNCADAVADCSEEIGATFACSIAFCEENPDDPYCSSNEPQ